MSKLQPNFSWQKYVGKPQDEKDQFQFQLQRQFILIANSVNSTIDDLSYFLRPRATSWAWVNGSQIYKVTLATTTWASGDCQYHSYPCDWRLPSDIYSRHTKQWITGIE